ncbi:hypothetical protein AWRI1499_2909 [Brettanomyces bruxellensis AWRI1499]|nr:hypothetical protein AWRI1499_2909 [Brettanomyces bruxellensis AWRI1499]
MIASQSLDFSCLPSIHFMSTRKPEYAIAARRQRKLPKTASNDVLPNPSTPVTISDVVLSRNVTRQIPHMLVAMAASFDHVNFSTLNKTPRSNEKSEDVVDSTVSFEPLVYLSAVVAHAPLMKYINAITAPIATIIPVRSGLGSLSALLTCTTAVFPSILSIFDEKSSSKTPLP